MDKEAILESAKSVEVLCFFGFEPSEIFCFLEKKPGKTYLFFKEQASFFNLEEDVYEATLGDFSYFESFCKQHVFQDFFYSINPQAAAKVSSFASTCKEIEWLCHLRASDYQDFGLSVFRNMVETAKKPIDADFFLLKKNALKGVPAIICGAGPSLASHIEELKKKQTKAVVFAGGASLGVLTREGISVDIAAGIDPNPSYERTLMQGSFEAPFFSQGRFSFRMLETIHGQVFRVPSNPGYPLEEWFQDGVSFDGGWTVSTFMTAIAAHFGCNPICLVGVDLASFEEDLYALNVSLQDPSEGIIWHDPVLGSCKTKKDWVLSAKWFEDLVQRFSDRIFYNASSQGLSLGMPYKSLGSFLSALPDRDISSLVWSISSSWRQSVGEDLKWNVLKKSIEDSLCFTTKILDLFAQFYPRDPSEKGLFVLALLDLQEELFYQKVLAPLWDIWQFPMARKFLDPYAREVNRFLFFQKILVQYKECLCST